MDSVGAWELASGSVHLLPKLAAGVNSHLLVCTSKDLVHCSENHLNVNVSAE